MAIELFGTTACAHTQELREWLEARRIEFVEYDVERDAAARERLRDVVPSPLTVPVLLEDGRVTRIGWNGRGCVVGA